MKGRQRDQGQTGNDGYQVFEVCSDRCQVLFVTVTRGKGITRGRIKDWLCSPDPYVTVQILGTPNGAKKTRHVPNTSDPEWNETLDFYIDPKRDRLIEFILYDLNRTVNEEIGREVFDFYGFSTALDNNIVISFKNGSKIEVKLRHQVNDSAQSMRFGLDLCAEEKVYLQQRKPKVLAGLSAFLGNKDDNPQSLSECPNICLMTSGGGFRAMIAFCGVYKAMEDVGLIDCVTYTSALSGSSWYLATLYTHPDYPNEPKVSHKIKPEIRKCVEKYWQVHLSPPWSSKYLRKIIAKGMNGQPVSFTDFYGYLVGQQLLKGRMKARLSDQANKIKDGNVPFPMYTCLHVKSNVSAKVFQEWYEFTPYEVSIPKYGVNFKTSDFASKFFMGEKIKSFPEVRLHFLYGIWGSAFTIQFKRLLQEKGRNGHGEILKMVLFSDDPSNDETKDEAVDANDFIARCLDPKVVKKLSLTENHAQDEDIILDCDVPTMINSDNDDELVEVVDENSDDHEILKENPKVYNTNRRRSLPRSLRKSRKKPIPQSRTTYDFSNCEPEPPIKDKSEEEEEERSKWNQFLEKALTISPIDSRAFRAGVIWNPLRGLTFNQNPLHTNVTSDDDDFKDFLECMKTDEKKIYLVDSGLSFNLPFPVTLRPQRGIEFYITCDFSSRKSDSTPPFRELLLAEKWANLHQIPFPPVRDIAKQHLNKPIQECYVFKDPTNNPKVPVVILFTLINKDFRNFKSPNVPRESDEEKNFANFDIFDNTNAYAIWRFVYPNQSFDRLSAMMEFNILNNLDVIRSEITEMVKRKKAQNTKVT